MTNTKQSPNQKQYSSAEVYEAKLERVMERLGVESFNFNWDRWSCFVEFRYKGELYRFDHSVEKAKARGVNLRYGSDAFAQVVLALEDLSRMVERGIYELQTWVAGMKFLSPLTDVPNCFKFLRFKEIPTGLEDVKERFRQLAKQYHPDAGGNEEDFKKLKDAAEKAQQYFDLKGGK
jgi:DnaJ-class molecular chaperone with C-terminal Zn finger domain